MINRVGVFGRVGGAFAAIRTLVLQDALGRLGLHDPIGKIKRYCRHWGDGRLVAIYASGNNPRGLEIIFQRKITGGDVKDGKLLPMTIEAVGRKRGKRVTGITISLESARGLHEVLGEALRDAERREKYKRNTALMNMYVSTMIDNVALVKEHAPSDN